MNGLYVVLGLVALYAILLFWLVTSGRLQKWNLGLMLGVVLMVRTQKGKRLIDWLSKPARAWNAFADLGIAVTLLGMLGMTVVFLWSVWFTLQPDSGLEPLGASEILVIPGVNPFVPLWYGIAALIVTLVVHEGGHGILARANAMKVKSLGLLMLVVPIGAFVEPDELDLKVAPRRKRLRVFAAGPLVNFAFAALTLIAFSALVGAATPRPGLHVLGAGGEPATQAGLATGDVLVEMDGQPLASWDQYRSNLANKTVGDPFTFRTLDGRELLGTVGSRWSNYDPAAQEEISQGTERGVAVCTANFGEGAPTGQACAERLQEAPFIGIQPLQEGDIAFLAHPFTSGGQGFLGLVSLPIGEVRGAPILSTLLPAFHDAPFEPAVFWPLVTLLFWIFWINLMVGLTNILPMIPLDGGHIFRDAVGGAVEAIRPGMSVERRERIVGRTAAAMSVFILTAFLLQIVGPRIVQALT